jgi:formate dehydrogenase subunit gamma
VCLLTGWWLLLGGEGRPSPIARILGVADTAIHVWVGRGLLFLAILPILVARRGVAAFARETARVDPGDGRWIARWPAAIVTGRFARHEGRFDPLQRIANALLLFGLAVLVASGVALTMLHGGPAFAVLARTHLVATVLVTPLIAGHVLVASGVLPGYRGVWRSMHLGGRLRTVTSRRIWPGWTERRERAEQRARVPVTGARDAAVSPSTPPVSAAAARRPRRTDSGRG